MHRKEKIADSELKQIVPMLAKAHTCLVPHTCPALHAHTLMPLHPVCPCAGTCLDRRPPPLRCPHARPAWVFKGTVCSMPDRKGRIV